MKNKIFNLQEKDIYELFNDIKLEESEFNDMDEEISSTEKERIKKSLNKKIKIQRNHKKLKYGSIAAAVSFIIIMGIGTTSPVFAKNVPILNSIIQLLNNKFGDHADYDKYSQAVNKSATDKGVTLTINEVMADDSKLILGYTIKSNKRIENLQVVGLSRFLKINGEHLGSGGSAIGNYVNDFTFVGSEEIDTTLPQNSKKYDVALNVDDIMGIKGKWNIDFTASKDALIKKSKVFKLNKKIDLQDRNITVDKVIMSPIDTSIFISGIYKNKVLESPESGISNDYIVFDDKGVELIPKGSGLGVGAIGSKNFRDEMCLQNSNHTPKYLTVIPYTSIASAGGGVSYRNGKETPIVMKTKQPKEISKVIDGTYPIELSQGKMGKVTIKEIKSENDKTIVKFYADGKAPYFQAENLWIKDDKGENLTPTNYDIRRNENKPNEFTLEFSKLNPKDKYTIYTNDFSNITLREDLKFKIELNK